MFHYSTLHWSYFLTACLVLMAVPGPDMAYMLSRAFSGGRRAGLAAVGGIISGAMVQGTAAFLGVSALIAATPGALDVVKWAGAVWLIWLGVSAVRSASSALSIRVRAADDPLWQVWRGGMLVNLLNPKAILFFMAFMPQQVEPGAGPAWAQMALHCVLLWTLAAATYAVMVTAGARLSAGFARNERAMDWFNRAAGVVFIGFGLKLAASKL